MKNYIRDEDVARTRYVAMPAPMESGLINYREAFKVALSVGFQGMLCTEHYGGDGLSSPPATGTTCAATSCPRPTATPSATARWRRDGSSPPPRTQHRLN